MISTSRKKKLLTWGELMLLFYWLVATVLMACLSIPACMFSVRWAWKNGWTVRKILMVFTPASVVQGGVLGYTMACLVLNFLNT
nr:MAG TPA: hypothetical protein [Caudoviricetes sp.]